jgi:hypothetical protein
MLVGGTGMFIRITLVALCLTLMSGNASAGASMSGNHLVQSVRLTDKATIEILFTRPVRPESLTPQTIHVISEKQSRDVTDAFRFEYNVSEHKLTLRPINPLFDFGSGNIVTVIVGPNVQDAEGKPMGKEFRCSLRP